NTQRLNEDYLPNKTDTMKPEVLVIVDEELSFWDTSYGSLSENILSNRYPLAKTGTSYDLFLRTDWDAIATREYKVIWLMGLLQLNAGEKIQIEKWRRKGITVLWTNKEGTTIYYKGKSPTF